MPNEQLRESLKHELICGDQCQDTQKDILIVNYNNLSWLETCIDSIYDHTELFRLFIWDNGSDVDTRRYLEELSQRDEVTVLLHHENIGFIKPNNRLAEMGNAPYVILLNNDTEVHEGWDQALLGYLQSHPETRLVGYMGGTCDESGRGIGPRFGSDIGYVMGWCLCFRREMLESHVLFDEENLEFAYGEDADLSFRLKEAGDQIYALNVQYVHHEGNVTSQEVLFESDIDEFYEANLEYLQQRWPHILDGD